MSKSIVLPRSLLVLLLPMLLVAASMAQPLPPDTCLPEGCRTQTQGGWGAGCQGNNPGCIRDANFDACFGEQLVIGGGFTLTFTSAAAVEAFLPAGGTPGVLTQSYVDPVGDTEAGVFAGQVLALALSLGFSNCDVATFCPELASLVIYRGDFDAYTVQEIFDLANAVLGGDLSGLPLGLTVSDLSDVVAAINENFVDGDTDNGMLVLPECDDGEQLPNVWDMGDLQECYPTDILNPAHRVSGIAHLGAGIDAEDVPDILDLDAFDDGVSFLGTPWMPCTSVEVQVTVSAGENYGAFADTGGVLYLNGYKDGNLDCDFCDVFCEGAAPEWFIQNQVVTPGTQNFTFTDPGVLDFGRYDGRFRFRLSMLPLTCATGGTDDVGEVEDYIIEDMQLAVELMGGLLAQAGNGSVTLTWTTASETNNDRFEILRDGALCGTVEGSGTSAARHNYRFSETGLQNGRTYHYTLIAVDAAGAREELATAAATPQGESGVITSYALLQNYPNPFNPATRITFHLPEAQTVKLTVFNAVGQEVATLVNGPLAEGAHTVSFDAGQLPAGIYLYRLDAGSFTQVRKMLLIK